MNVGSASSTNNLWKLIEASKTTSAKGVASNTSSVGTGSVTSAASDGSTLSGAAKLFSKLDLLSKSNPTEFKKITSQIATQLQAAAKQSSDPSQAGALNQLAKNFQNASTSGNFSDLFAQAPGSAAVSQTSHSGGHHHHYHADGDSDSNSGSQSSTDPLSTIFSNALTQISSDLQSSPASALTRL